MKKETWRIILNVTFILLGLVAIILPITFGALNLINEEYSDPWYWMQIFLMPFVYCAFLFFLNFGLQKLIFRDKKVKNQNEKQIKKKEKMKNINMNQNSENISKVKNIKITKKYNIFKNIIWMFVFLFILMIFAEQLWEFLDISPINRDTYEKILAAAWCFGIIFSSLAIIYNIFIIIIYSFKVFISYWLNQVNKSEKIKENKEKLNKKE